MSEAPPLSPLMTDLSHEDALQERADHEAGHFVALNILEIPHTPKFLTLGMFEGSGGGCCFDHGDIPIEQGVIQGLAGMVAHIEGIKRRNGWEENSPEFLGAWRRCFYGGLSDQKDLEMRYGGDMEAFRSYFEMTKVLIAANWALVEGLSRELKIHHVLYHEEPRIILDGLRGQGEAEMVLRLYRHGRHLGDHKSVDGVRFKNYHPTLPWFESIREFWNRYSENQRILDR